MNGTVSRRVFVGSLAGAGVGAVGATSLLDFPVSAQPASTALTREIRRQLKDAFGKMQSGQAAGATQAATVLRLYASTVDNDQLRAALRKVNRQQILLAQVDHRELAREAEELGLNPSRLPPHSVDRVGRETAFELIRQEGLSPTVNRVADFVQMVGAKMEALERSGRAGALQIALRQPIPDTVDCGNCNQEKGQVDSTDNIALVACAAAVLIPALAPACAAATATFLTFYFAYAACLAILQLCEAYYN